MRARISLIMSGIGPTPASDNNRSGLLIFIPSGSLPDINQLAEFSGNRQAFASAGRVRSKSRIARLSGSGHGADFFVFRSALT